VSAYYNENDPKAAAWLRELIKAGLIAPGDVDERSITEVQPNDLKPYTQCHFFAGIAGWSLALRLAGVSDDEPIWSGSCPCQPWSDKGDRLGESDPRHLWPTWFRLIEERSPAIILSEQVASKAALRWLDGVFDDLERAQYACAAADLPSASVGAPLVRQRLFWMAHLDGSRLPNTQGCQGSAGERGRPVSTPCHFEDGSLRRLPEPGFRTVVDELSGCPPLVRGYGNAINPELAAEFIRAAFEAIPAPIRGHLKRL
jgi:DNA (cytosine-5)-methyltransferase 1